MCNAFVTRALIKYIIDKVYSVRKVIFLAEKIEKINPRRISRLWRPVQIINTPKGKAVETRWLRYPRSDLERTEKICAIRLGVTMTENRVNMMDKKTMPRIFRQLQSEGVIKESEILQTQDGFRVVYKSLSDILLSKGIVDFPDSEGERLACSKFFDDWFLYAVPNGADDTYSLLKLREQEYDAKDGSRADGDTPGVTISFVPFRCEMLLDCLADPTDENAMRLDSEINRVVVYRGQRHHKALKRYFNNPVSEGAYLVADLYIRHIAACCVDGCLKVPEQYQEIVQQSISYKKSAKPARLPQFIASLNQKVGYSLCDNKTIYIQNPERLTEYEAAAILATHTGNTSVYSFAAEVEYHAKFLTPAAKIKLPFFGRSIYDSAIRADMTICDTEFEGPAPFYRQESKIVKRQYALHSGKQRH